MYYNLPQNSFLKIKPNEKMLSVVLNGTRINVVINDTAYDILRCCNGKNTFDSIMEILNEQYVSSSDMVSEFLEQNIGSGIVQFSQESYQNNFQLVKGNDKIYYPDILIWEITNICPLKCKHCYLGDRKNIWFQQEDIDDIIQLVKEKGITTVQLTGGELFAHPNIEYIVDRLNELDIIVSLSTSGYIFDDTVENVIKKLKCNASVRISLDGDKQYHNRIRGKSDAYDKAIKFMEFVKQSGIQLQIGTVILDQSEDMIRNLILFARKIGASSHSFSVVLEEGNAYINKQKSKYSNMQLQQKLAEWSRMYDTESYKIQLPQNNGLKNCGCGYKLIRLRPDFSVTPCPMIDYEIGNLKTDNFDLIMSRGTRIFEDIYSPKNTECTYCGECSHDKECGDCIAMALVKNRIIDEQCIWVRNNKYKLSELLQGCYNGI